MEQRIQKFIERLSCEEVGNLVENMYRNDAQRDNLRLYLTYLCEKKPTYMLVGEAPGYKGCGVTGIPFTDENEMKNNLGTSQAGYCFIDENNPQRESSACVIWEAIRKKTDAPIPLLWNAYPFHPFGDGRKESNRKPNKDELCIGKYYLEELIDIFDIPVNRIYAVGRVAQEQLGFRKDESYIRHPAYGGKIACIEGILSI